MPPPETDLRERLKGFLLRHSGLLTIGFFLVLSWAVDHEWLGGSIQHFLVKTFAVWIAEAVSGQAQMRVIILLPLATLFLAFSNLYLKISVRAPGIQRRLRPGSFLSFPFAVYFGVYLMLAILTYTFLAGKVSNWFVAIVLSAIVGIGAANADVKFGGISLQPLAEFLQSLEAVVEAGISTNLNELDIAKRASLRDQLAHGVPKERMESECILLGLSPADLEALRARAPDEQTYVGLLSIEVIKKSEANAWRLVAESSRDTSRYRIRWWSI